MLFAMKKPIAKPKAKPAKTAAAKPTTAKKPPASPHDHLHSLLRGTHASKICR